MHIRPFRKTAALAGGLLVLASFNGGCANYVPAGGYSRQANTKTDPPAGPQPAAYAEAEERQRLVGRVEGLELNLDRMEQDMQRIKSAQSSAGGDRTADLSRRISELELRIGRMESDREKLKSEIVDALTRKMAEIYKTAPAKPGVAKNTGKSPVKSDKKTTPAAASAGGGNTGGDVGYEHPVQAGETLSQIAKAYGVSVKRILDANNMADAKDLRAGQKLFIPKKD